MRAKEPTLSLDSNNEIIKLTKRSKLLFLQLEPDEIPTFRKLKEKNTLCAFNYKEALYIIILLESEKQKQLNNTKYGMVFLRIRNGRNNKDHIKDLFTMNKTTIRNQIVINFKLSFYTH